MKKRSKRPNRHQDNLVTRNGSEKEKKRVALERKKRGLPPQATKEAITAKKIIELQAKYEKM